MSSVGPTSGRNAETPAAASGDHQTDETFDLRGDDPTSNYQVRIRRPLDDLVSWRIAQLRRAGLRTSKVEITEALLWELRGVSVDELQQRIEQFREQTGRS